MRRRRGSMHVRDSTRSLRLQVPQKQTGGQQRK
jgi:hypothetical protein